MRLSAEHRLHPVLAQELTHLPLFIRAPEKAENILGCLVETRTEMPAWHVVEQAFQEVGGEVIPRSVAGVFEHANVGLVAILCLLFIHPRAPNLIGLRSAGTMPA